MGCTQHTMSCVGLTIRRLELFNKLLVLRPFRKEEQANAVS